MVAEPPTLEDLLEQTATLISNADDAGKMSKRMQCEAEKLNNRLASYNYVVETKRQELQAMARKFLNKWCDWERDGA